MTNSTTGTEPQSREAAAAWLSDCLAAAAQCDAVRQTDLAEQHYQNALQAAGIAFGPESAEISKILISLGGVYLSAGRLPDAQRSYVKALEMAEHVLGPDHEQLAEIYRNLGAVELARGRFATGEPYARRSLEIRERALGPNHVTVAEDVEALAELLEAQRRFAESEALYQRAIEVFEGACGTAQARLSACQKRLRNVEALLAAENENASHDGA